VDVCKTLRYSAIANPEVGDAGVIPPPLASIHRCTVRTCLRLPVPVLIDPGDLGDLVAEADRCLIGVRARRLDPATLCVFVERSVLF
jgi:hypothetical protein